MKNVGERDGRGKIGEERSRKELEESHYKNREKLSEKNKREKSQGKVEKRVHGEYRPQEVGQKVKSIVEE